MKRKKAVVAKVEAPQPAETLVARVARLERNVAALLHSTDSLRVEQQRMGEAIHRDVTSLDERVTQVEKQVQA